MDATTAPSAWVFHAEGEREMRRAGRLVGRIGVTREIAIDRTTFCVELADPPSDTLQLRLERRLDGPVEPRLDCDVAWYPLGRGYVAYSVTQPAPSLEAVLEEYGPIYLEVVRPSDPAQPVRVCLPMLAVADPLALAEALEAQGTGVVATYEVGGCRRSDPTLGGW